ncbi:hypothetical protein ACOSQ3_010915 [Xanthoceras sorbifolium]
MDTEGITKLCAGLKLIEEEGEAVHIRGTVKADGMKKISLYLVRKLLTSKLTNRDAFRSLIGKIWRMTYPVEVETVRENIYAFHFHDLLDRKRVTYGWTLEL